MNDTAVASKTLRIAVAEDDPDIRSFFRSVLKLLGHDVVGLAADGVELVELCERESPDFVLADIAMPNLDGIAATERVWKTRPLPIMLVSAHYDKHIVQRAQLDYVMAYLVKPVDTSTLRDAIVLAQRRFEHYQVLRADARTTVQALQERKMLERAKAILMQGTNLDEGDAFERLQAMALENGRRLAEVAESVTRAAQISEGLSPG